MLSRSLIILLLLGAGTCNAVERARGFEQLSFFGFDEAAYSEEARQGLQNIFAGHLFHMALPAGTARLAIRGSMASAESLGYDPDTDEGRFYVRGFLPSPPNRTAGSDPSFGLGESAFERDDRAMVNFNCFACHAGVVNGQVVAGLGNSHINQSEPRKSLTRGDNFGPYAVWEMGSRLADPANQGMVLAEGKTELQVLFESLTLPPVDPMPWWVMKYKELDYWYADAGIHDAASFSINFTTPHAQMNEHRPEHIKIVAKALAFARETQSPPFPETLDAELVQRGADLFHGRVRPQDNRGFRTCKSCHGTYSKQDGNADYSQPGSYAVDYDYSHVLRNVKTDTAYNDTLQQLAPIAEHINKLELYYSDQGTPELIPHASVPNKSGYVAPPLVGVWASAPYFHNGSVPTIEAVLNSSIRPEIWSRDHRDPHAYDFDQVGMAHQSWTRLEFDESAEGAAGKPFGSAEALDHAAIYDTQAFGHGNSGHTFGDSLTDDERRAVIEFLKSLSGPDMQ